jgi:hypothetical protein
MGKRLLDTFPIQNGLKQRHALSSLLFTFALEYAIKKVQAIQVGFESIGRTSFWSMVICKYVWNNINT